MEVRLQQPSTKRDVCCRFWQGLVGLVRFCIRRWQQARPHSRDHHANDLPARLKRTSDARLLGHDGARCELVWTSVISHLKHKTAARNLRRPLSCPSLLTLCISSTQRHVHVSKSARAWPKSLSDALLGCWRLSRWIRESRGEFAFIPVHAVARIAAQPSSMLSTFSIVHLSSSRFTHGSGLRGGVPCASQSVSSWNVLWSYRHQPKNHLCRHQLHGIDVVYLQSSTIFTLNTPRSSSGTFVSSIGRWPASTRLSQTLAKHDRTSLPIACPRKHLDAVRKVGRPRMLLMWKSRKHLQRLISRSRLYQRPLHGSLVLQPYESRALIIEKN